MTAGEARATAELRGPDNRCGHRDCYGYGTTHKGSHRPVRSYGPVLALGAGVQSTAITLMVAEGILPKIVAGIFSDTGWEPKAVYEHLDRLDREVMQPAGIPLIRVQWGDIRTDATEGHRWLKMPVFVVNTKPAGFCARCKKDMPAHQHRGQATRQCTKDYKVDPIKRKLKELMGAKISVSGAVLPPPRGTVMEQWIGISTDEVHRAKDADEPWLVNRHPLLDLGVSRADCIAYLTERGWGATPKSACVGCPFHNDVMWAQLTPDEWDDAVEFDRQLRSGVMRHGFGERAFLHTQRVPLDQVKLRPVVEQPGLFDEQPGCSPFTCVGGDDEQDEVVVVGEGDAA